MTLPIRELVGSDLDTWDAAAVDAPGGHIFQSRAWAAHRESSGWRPRFLAAGEMRALALVRSWPVVGGGSAYLPRGPVGPGTPWTGDGSGAAVGETLVAADRYLAGHGVDVVAADAEVAASDTAYLAMLGDAGFRGIPEIQPSRHRMSLALPVDGDAAGVLSAVAKSTRQRIRNAERAGVVIVRHDARGAELEGFTATREQADVAMRRFYDLLHATGDRVGFTLGAPSGFVAWWLRALGAGHLVYLEAREGGADGPVLGGLVLYRHGHRLSTAHSGDVADRRRDHPGTMHLLRWRAIQLALAEGRPEMDLGGVDVVGARRHPEPGEPTFGLYEHKRSFGATWVELAGAQERVGSPVRYAAGRLTTKLASAAGQRRGGG